MIVLQSAAGQPFKAADVTVTPQSKALIVRLPFFAFVWNRPVAVEIERNGAIERMPIHDHTRLMLLILATIGLVFPVAAWSRATRRKER